jgi:hypothetical protein
MRRALLVVVLILGLLALPSVASAGSLAVRSVSAPSSATAGMPVGVEVTVTRTGRTRAAKLRFYLSADRKRDRRDVRLQGDAASVSSGRARKVVVAARPAIPAGQALGAYRVIACLDACAATRRPVRVTATPVGTRELVASAVATGKITHQQGLVYRVLAATGDPRLPAAYAGDDSAPEHTIMSEVLDEWPSLSAAQRRQVQPFFTPPAAKGVWASGAARAAQSGSGPQPKCVTNQLPNADWRSIARPRGHVRIWWLKDDEARVGPKARSFLADIENHMWPKLVAVFGREPLPDGNVRCFHGLDSKLDIYMGRLDRGRALTVPYPPRCGGAPAFIYFNAWAGPPDHWDVAHELTHAFQFAYRYHAPCSNYADWDEAVGNWGGSYLYPKLNDEHYYPWFMRDPEDSLADASYEGWVFPYAMQQLHGTGPIRSIYEQVERRDVLQAIDAGVPGGLKKAWPEFARLAWNQDPVEPTFRHWDGFKQLPEVNGAPIAAEELHPGFGGETVVEVPLDLKPLTRAYRRFRFGPDVTQITIEKPMYANLNLQALIKTRDGRWRTEEWDGLAPVYCPQDARERPEEIIFVISNNSLSQPITAGSQPLRLKATNLGCTRYVGEGSGTSKLRNQLQSIDESWTFKGLVYERYLPFPTVPRFLFRVAGGSVTWSMSGHDNGCSVKAGPATLQLSNGGLNGQLEIYSAITNGVWNRRYWAAGYGLPAVQGTATCPHGSFTRWFRPNGFLSTSVGANNMRTVAPDGALEGSETHAEGTGRTSSYSWRLVPER